MKDGKTEGLSRKSGKIVSRKNGEDLEISVIR
jgi:hypothetical protein